MSQPVITKINICPSPAFSDGVWRCPASPDSRGFYSWGFDRRHDASLDLLGWEGFDCVLALEQKGSAVLRAFFADGRSCQAELSLPAGQTHLFVPLDGFDLPSVSGNIWRFLTALEITGCTALSVTALRSRALVVQCAVRGQSVKAGCTAVYTVQVTSVLDAPAFIRVQPVCHGWEALETSCSPAVFPLGAGETREVSVSQTLPFRLPAGAWEQTDIRFTADGDGASAETLSLVTMCALTHPYIYHNAAGWAEAAHRGQDLPQFRRSYETYIGDADAWIVSPPEENKPYCYATQQEHYFMSAAYAFAMTGELRYAEKIASFFRYFCPAYLIRQRGCSQSYVQEGHFFQHLAIAYDIIHDAGVLSETDHQNVEACFRFYMEVLARHLLSGHISNWLLSEITGALYCAFSLQDPERVLRFALGIGGTEQQLIRGTFNDGWWHECSVSYNTWVSSMLLHTARVLALMGIDWIHRRFPVSFSRYNDAVYFGEKTPLRFDMDNERRGAMPRLSLSIKDIFDAPLPYLDDRGVIFGICDSYERRLEGIHFGSTYELAYQYYRDPRYAAIIRAMEFQDCVFGVENLPESFPELGSGGSAHSDNIGIVMLRSASSGRAPRERIQAVLRYGSHGYAHGHFDRASLLSVMRYGRSFFNPECVWWGYPHFMYKFYVQNSMTKNMVVVDEKHQNVADSRLTLFTAGSGFQAACVETETTWSYPPFGGMVYDENESLPERCRYNGCSLRIPENAPAFGQTSGFTEPILTRRLLVVTDDYLVLFDHLRGTQPHRFSNLFQIKGFTSLTGSVEKAGHSRRFSDDPLSDAQFVTDCSHYEASDASCAHFVTVFGPGEDLRGTRSEQNEPGLLKMDVHNAWPPRNHQIIGLTAEDHKIYIPTGYTLCADSRTLKKGEEGFWLGFTESFHEEVAGAETLTFSLKPLPLVTEQLDPFDSPQGLFLGHAFLTLSDGSRVRLCDLPHETVNIDPGFGLGRDYEGGRVLLGGMEAPDAIPVSPLDHSQESSLVFRLDGLDAVSLDAELGVDPFPGNEDQRRRTYAIQQNGPEARFTTVIEPFEGESAIAAVNSPDPDTVFITLRNGRRQTLRISGWTESAPAVTFEQNEKL